MGSPYRGGLLDLGLYLLHSSLGLGTQYVSKPVACRKRPRDMVVWCENGSSLELVSLPLYGKIQHATPSDCQGGQVTRRAFFATALSFLGAVFLVTPVGLAPAFLVVVVVVVFDFARGLRAIAGAVSTVWNTRGFELPVADRVPSRAIVGDMDGSGLWARRVSRVFFQNLNETKKKQATSGANSTGCYATRTTSQSGVANDATQNATGRQSRRRDVSELTCMRSLGKCGQKMRCSEV